MTADSTMPRVLIVDDDPAVLRLLRVILEKEGYSVSEASDGRAALQKIEADPPDVVITDWMMEPGNGIELCRAIRCGSYANYIYVIMLTSLSGSDNAVQGLDAGADDFLCKPIDRETLLARLRAGTRLIDLERRLVKQATQGALAGISPRLVFLDWVRKEIARSRRYQLSLSCAVLEVESQLSWNDPQEQFARDAVLREVGAALLRGCRESDVVGHLDHEKFAVLLPETAEADANVWAERMRGQIGELPVMYGDKQLAITVSIGLAEWKPNHDEHLQLLDIAEQALLVAKQSGGNRVVGYSTLDDHFLDMVESLAEVDLFHGATAADCMTRPVPCLCDHDPLHVALEFICRHQLNSAPVIDASGKLCGILSERDVLTVMLAPGAWRQPVAHFMKRNIVTFGESTPLRQIHNLFCRTSIRRVIVASDGHPVGVISRRNVLQWFNNWMKVHGRATSMMATAVGREAEVAALDPLVRSLMWQVDDLHTHLTGQLDGAAPLIVNRATQMQDLLERLLQYAQSDSTESA